MTMESHDSEFSSAKPRRKRPEMSTTLPPVERDEELTTSISANVVRSIQVTMSGAEMNVMLSILERAKAIDDSLSPMERAIIHDLIGAVERLS